MSTRREVSSRVMSSRTCSTGLPTSSPGVSTKTKTTRKRTTRIVSSSSDDDDDSENRKTNKQSLATKASKTISRKRRPLTVNSDTDDSPTPAKRKSAKSPEILTKTTATKQTADRKRSRKSTSVIDLDSDASPATVKKTRTAIATVKPTKNPGTVKPPKRGRKNITEAETSDSSFEFLLEKDREAITDAARKPTQKHVPHKNVKPILNVSTCSISSCEFLSDDNTPVARPSTSISKKQVISTNTNRRSSRYIPPPRDWNPAQLLADQQSIDYVTAQHIIRLFDEDNTIPFMCRYRRELIGDLSPEQMRDIKMTYNHIQNVKQKADTMLRHLEKEDLCTDEIRSNIACARSLDELEHLYAPFKPASKLALSERARAIGLQMPAETLLFGEPPVQPLQDYVNVDVAGLESLLKVHEGMQHIGAHMISKDSRVLDELRLLQHTHRIQLTAKLIPAKDEKPAAAAKRAGTAKSAAPTKAVDPSKFETYFAFRQNVCHVRPHQVLAINRGESLKVLSVKVEVPDSLRNDLYRFAKTAFLSDGLRSGDRERFFDKSFDVAYTKKLQPLVCRHVRGELTKVAEAAAIEVFATNLKQLLLMSPVKGERILGIDPGFTNGCKLAMISEQTTVLATDVIYPHTRRQQAGVYGDRIARLMAQHECSLIALGNGTACRETERWLGGLMADGVLDAGRVRYCIVSEQGASIYSCSDVAKQEFSDLDVNLISAASIARRLNDPLGEFVKVEPRHLGVGMYQHDVNEKLLAESLNEVVMECVSFVGVDINTASVALLRHVAGLTAVRAANIIKHREDNGPFVTREQLKKVKQIGPKTFVQCAGFVRIEPLTAGPKAVKAYDPLDSTWVHPESYALARQLVASSGGTAASIGTAEGIARIGALLNQKGVGRLAEEMGAPEERVQSVLAALQRELLRDYRVDVDKRPMFKQGLTSMADLREGTAVSGAITNQTHFGCFVDIGVEKDGLIHSSQLGGMQPNIGDRVEALVKEVDVKRGRIQLKLVAIS